LSRPLPGWMTDPAAHGNLPDLYHRLLAAYGRQDWWPAEHAFEVMLGAVLTQNTDWRNVERALAVLKAALPELTPELILDLPEAELAALIRPAGYFNVKARRLRALCRFVTDAGGIETLATWPLAQLRPALLAVHGVGHETADDILLYAFDHPVFVVDAYTRRILSRLGLVHADIGYESLRHYCEARLPPSVGLFNELHALLVTHGKQHCRPRPRCESCPLQPICPLGRAVAHALAPES